MDLYLTIKPLHIQYIGCPRKIKSQIGLESFSGHQYIVTSSLAIPAGRHALLNIGDGTLTSLVLSDAQGHNFRLEAGSGAGISSAMAEQTAPQRVRGIYIVNGQKVVK